MKIKLPRKVHMMGFKIKKHSPEILIAVGVTGVVTSTVMACRATLKVHDILEDDKKDLEIIHEEADGLIADETKPYTEKDKKTDLVTCYTRMGFKLVKLYAPSVILGSLSIASILTSHKIIKSRNMALGSTLAMTEKAFREYRERVAEQCGVEKERDIRYNIKEIEREEEVTLKNGKKKKKKVKEKVITGKPSIYSRFFDDSSPHWTTSPDANMIFLAQTQRYMNETLEGQGYLFLNDVYKALGFKPTKIGRDVGWLYDPNVVEKISFFDEIYDIHSIPKRAFVNGDENVVLLDFNVDGNIVNDVFSHETREGFGLEE